MKYFGIILMLLIAVAPLAAQEETLFSGSVDIGGYGGPGVRATNALGEMGVLVGGYGGVLIDHRLMIGGGGYGLATEHRARPAAQLLYGTSNRTLLANFGYGGAVLEYIILPAKLVHFTAHLLIGGGAFSYRVNQQDWYGESVNHNPDTFFVLEPGVNIELNIVSWMRADVGATYRYVSGLGDLVGVSNADFRQVSAGLTLKFGAF